MIGLPYADVPGRTRAGVVHVVFATSRTGSVSIDDPALRGFRIIGGPYYEAGVDVAAAGDVNGDGRGDILLSAPRHGVRCTSPTDGPCGYKSPGTAFVIYGTPDQATIDLAHLTASQGFAIKGIPGAAGAGSGGLAGLGDFTGDGFGAVAVTGSQYTRDGLHYRPGAYVIYGGRHLGTVDLQDIGSRGFRITSRDVSQSLLVSPAGHVNGDRRTDLLLDGPPNASVLFGARYHGTISTARLGRHGFAITGLAQGSGLPMTGVGDLNGDRRSDLLIVRSEIAPGGLPPAEVDVVYGSSSTRTVRLARLGSRGFRMRPGPVASGHNLQLGPVAALGDLNGDGRADFGITALTYPPGGRGALRRDRQRRLRRPVHRPALARRSRLRRLPAHRGDATLPDAQLRLRREPARQRPRRPRRLQRQRSTRVRRGSARSRAHTREHRAPVRRIDRRGPDRSAPRALSAGPCCRTALLLDDLRVRGALRETPSSFEPSAQRSSVRSDLGWLQQTRIRPSGGGSSGSMS